MQANELRLGNWIEIDGIAYPTNASDISNIELGAKANPIQLNEDWLLKFGFQSFIISFGNAEKLELDWDGDHYNIFYSQKNIYGKMDKILMYVEIKHVHQLQNLVHALTNEELTIKEKTYTLPKVDKSKVEKYDRT